MAKIRRGERRRAFVLVCSVTVAWFFDDEVNAYTEAVEEAMKVHRGPGPELEAA